MNVVHDYAVFSVEQTFSVEPVIEYSSTGKRKKCPTFVERFRCIVISWKQNGELIPGTPRKVQLNDGNDIEILLEKWFSSEYLPEIHSLINDFDLTPVTEEWLI